MTTIKKIIDKLKSGILKELSFELHWIFSTVKQYMREIVLYTVLSLITVIFTMTINTQLKQLVDSLISQNIKALITIVIVYLVIGTTNIVLSMFSQRLACSVNYKVRKDITSKVYTQVLSADWSHLYHIHTGDLMTRLQEDITIISESVVGWIPNILSQCLQIVVSLGIIIYYDISMLGIIIIALPIVLVSSRIFLNKMYIANQKARNLSSEITSLHKESLHNIQTIKAFGLTSCFSEKMKRLQEKNREVNLEVNKYSMFSWAALYISGQLAAIICLAWSVYHVYKGVITLGTMTLIVVFATTVATSFKTLVQIIPNVINTIAASKRVRELTLLPAEDTYSETVQKKVIEQSMECGANIVVRSLKFGYTKEKLIFDSVDLRANIGEIVALVGPSGEGKTTMLRLLLGLLTPSEGSLDVVIGSESYPLSPMTRRVIAYVPQGNTMMSGTILENMRLICPNATEEEVINALKCACAYEFVKKLKDGLNHKVEESGGGFSEGQNQRLAIARAVLCQAPILFLDEATSALDVATERKVLHNLMDHHQNRTCILTTHRPSVLSMCDKVYRINQKQVTLIAEDGIRQLMNEF